MLAIQTLSELFSKRQNYFFSLTSQSNFIAMQPPKHYVGEQFFCKYQKKLTCGRAIYLKRLGEQSCKNQLFKVTNKGKPPRMFSLACNLSKTDVEFLPIGISSKKVRANNVDFTTIKITLKKVSGNNMDFSTKEITSKKYVETTWIFRQSKLYRKKHI